MERTPHPAALKSGNSRPFPGRALVERAAADSDFDSNWLITLSDLLSLLLIFFVMFSVTTGNAGKAGGVKTGATVGPPAPVAVLPATAVSPGRHIAEEMNSIIRKLDLGNDVSVRAADREIVITMNEKITFRPGEAEILKGSEPILDNIAGLILRYPSYLVDIEGHTDNVPIHTRLYPSNWELSVARAMSVLKYFIGNRQIDPSRLSVKGDADHKPIVPNGTPQERAQNRRVEIRMKEKEP